MKLHWVDYLLFAVFLAGSIGIGLYHGFTGGKQKTTSEFLLANRKLRVIPTMISLLVSFQSAILIIGLTAEMYTRGILLWIWASLAYCISIIFTERVIVPWIYPLKLPTVFKYLEMRYKSKAVRTVGALTGIFEAVLYMGIAMFAPSIALEAVSGLPVHWGMPLMALVCTIYTAIGGMRAVIWTDVFQFAVMFAGMLGVLIKGNMEVGGFGRTMEVAGEEGRLIYADWSFDPRVRHTVWSLTIAFSISWAQIYGLNQASVQRFTATQTETEARQILLLNIPFLILMLAMASMTGVTVLAYYSIIKCDPIASGQISNSNQLLPLFVMTIFRDSTGFAGIFLATLYSGALSSVSSSLSACSAILWADIIQPYFNVKKLGETQATLITKLAVIFFGIVATGVAFLAAQVPGPVTQITGILFGAIGGSKFSLFLLGGCFKRIEWKGTLFGSAFATVFMFWLCLGGQSLEGHQPPLGPVSTENCSSLQLGNITMIPMTTPTKQRVGASKGLSEEPTAYGRQLHGIENFYGISYIWYTVIGLVIAMSVGYLASFIISKFSDDVEDVPDELMIPFKKLFDIGCWRKTTKEKPAEDGEAGEKISLHDIFEKDHLLWEKQQKNETIRPA